MASPPSMDAFDAPMRDVVCTRRQRTDTPLQALVTMNDVQWIEAARALAQRVILEGGRQPEKRINLMSEILLSHDPPPRMAAVSGSIRSNRCKSITRPIQRLRTHWSELARRSAMHRIPEPELAAWTMVASEMLNLDETVTK